MNASAAVKELKALGSEQTAKTYRRHGADGEVYGVKYGDLYKVVKKIGIDHALANDLWKTGNHDARVLATMVADPGKFTASELDAWAKSATNQLALDAIAALAARTSHARKCAEKWIKSKDEWTAAAGWHLLASIAGGGREAKASTGPDTLTDAECEKYLAQIEKSIHSSKNRVRHSMNGMVIAVGVRNSKLQEKAIAAAKRIGTVEVDHGNTACVTPDAAKYIEKTAAYRAGKSSKKKTPAKTTRKSSSSSRTKAARKK